MSRDSELEELRSFIQADERQRLDQGQAWKSTSRDEDFDAWVRGESPDIEGMARKLKEQKESDELEQYLAFARNQMRERGYNPDTHQWERPEVEPERLTDPMPVVYQDEHGTPLVSDERFEHFADHESKVGQLSDADFQALIDARSAGRLTAYDGRESDPDRTNDVLFELTTGETGE